MEKIQNIKGTYDLLPEKSPLWRTIEATLAEIIESYGYAEIRTPIIEQTQLFKRSIGEVTDIVEKEMYTFSDRLDKHSLTLRPENTAGCVRACIQHNLFYGNAPRVWYTGPMFRYEKPQKDRYRQFMQMGAEAFGVATPDMDFEVIAMTARMWQALGIMDKVTLELNSIGSLESRKRYRAALVDYFTQHKSELDEDSIRRLETNPLRILDSKTPSMRPIIDKAPSLQEYLDEACQAHFSQLCDMLTCQGIAFKLNDRLVRGLDYYNRTVFEWTTECLGAQGTICGGGRYDSLVEQLGGDATPACGFAMGIERIIEVVQIANPDFVHSSAVDVFVVAVGDDKVNQFSIDMSHKLRQSLPSLHLMENRGGGNFKKQLKKADRTGASLALIVGENEMLNHVVTIKDLRNGQEHKEVACDELSERIKQLLG